MNIELGATFSRCFRTKPAGFERKRPKFSIPACLETVVVIVADLIARKFSLVLHISVTE